MDAKRRERVEIPKDEFELMAREIVRASESLWEGEALSIADDAIKLERLWPILDKYLKTKEDGKVFA